MKRILKIIGYFLLSLLLIVGVLLVLIQTSWFQTWATQKIAGYFSEEWNTVVSLDRVDIDFFATLVLENVYLEDQHGDTLAFAKSVALSGVDFDREELRLELGSLTLDSAYFALRYVEADSALNLNFLIDYFAGDTTTSTDSSVFSLLLDDLELINSRFVFDDATLGQFPGLMQYGDLDISRINIGLSNTSLIGDSLRTTIDYGSAQDHCGLTLEAFQSDIAMGPTLITLDNTHLETKEALLNGRVAFKFNSFAEWLNFNTGVRMNHELTDSRLNIRELKYFASDLDYVDKVVLIDGHVGGRVSNLRSTGLYLQLDEHTWFSGRFRLDGLPDIESTFITLDVEELVSTKEELDRIPAPPFEEGAFIETPEAFAKLGQMRFTGNYTGFINDFTAYGTLETLIGNVSSDITLHETNDLYTYKGNFNLDRFDLAEFFDNDMLGPVTTRLEIDGQGLNMDDLDAHIQGSIDKVVLNDYSYDHIRVNGEFKDKYFNGDLSIGDENLFADFSGKVDFSTSRPAFSFDAEIHNIDLVDLHFYDDKYSSLSANITADMKGNSFQDIEGIIKATDIEYCSLDDECRVEEISLSAYALNPGREIKLQSSIVDGSLTGEYQFETLAPSIMGILSDLIPSFDYTPDETIALHKENFELKARIKDFSVIRDFFIPDLDMSEGTMLQMDIDDQTNQFSSQVVSDSISYMDYSLVGLTVDARRQDSAIYFTTISDHFYVSDSLSFDNFSIDGRTENDTLFTSLSWENEEDRHSGDLNLQMTIRGILNYDVLFNSAQLTLQDEIWNFDPNAYLRIDSTRLEVRNFSIFNEYQRLDINGIVSEHPKPWLTVQLHNLQLDNFNPFLKGSGTELDGVLSGEMTLRDAYDKKLIQADLIGLNLAVNGYEIGDVCLESTYDKAHNRMLLAGELSRLENNEISFGGWYSPTDEEQLNINLRLNHLKLALVNSFISEGISDIDGTVSGNIEVTGRVDAPQLNGSMDFENASVRLDYLGTKYFIKEQAGVYPDMFTLDRIKVIDEQGNQGYLTGAVIHDNFENWNFDVYLDIEEEPFMCLNTTEFENDLYYGQAFAKGYINIFGYLDNLEIDVNAEVGEDTNLSLPLGGSEDVTFEDFIVFVDHNNEVEEKQVDLSGIQMNLELDIMPEAEFRLIFDEAVGDVMEGRGLGHVSMEITPLGDFYMYGLMEIVDGSYLFTLKNLINKEFTVKPGGTIAWYGDPLAADINLETVYSLTTSLQTLLGDDYSQYSNRVPVDLIMNLDGKLMNPGINFNIQLPGADEITRSRLAAAISSEEEMNRQAFALLVLRSFVSPPNISSTKYQGGAVAEISSELVSRQLSNWLSQISNDFDIGFNYRPGDEISNEEIAVALSTQLFNDRLLLSGNFGVSNGNDANSNPSGLIGDLKVEYKITSDGKIRLVVYNESNDFQTLTTDQSAYNQGVGVLYKEEFDTMDEFFCGFKNLFLPKDKQLDCY
ncbi:MAG: translocation/assembly module TamB [Flavobacteriales bacterium]|nr:translocation/assembly module TamB [Flavobacteriales bacterium]